MNYGAAQNNPCQAPGGHLTCAPQQHGVAGFAVFLDVSSLNSAVPLAPPFFCTDRGRVGSPARYPGHDPVVPGLVALGPANRYGDPAGHAWVAVAGPVAATRHVLTGLDDRAANMDAFAEAALALLVETLS